MIRAIADARVDGAEPVLLVLQGASDPNMQKEVLYALSCVGSSNSLPVLAKSGRECRLHDGSDWCQRSLYRFVEAIGPSDRDAVMKAAKKLQKAAAKAGQEQTREAALQILLAAEEPAKVSKMVIAAMKDPSKNYRNAALSYASGFADKELYIELMKMVPKKPNRN